MRPISSLTLKERSQVEFKVLLLVTLYKMTALKDKKQIFYEMWQKTNNRAKSKILF